MSRAAEAGIIVLFGQLVYREASIFLGKWPKYEGRITKAINSLPRVAQLLPDLVGAGGPEQPPPDAARDSSATASSPDAAGNGSLGELFRSFSKSALDYVLRHTLG